MNKNNGLAGGVYGLGFIGALIYYIQHAGTFVIGLLGFLKALVWPAMLVYKLLEFLKKNTIILIKTYDQTKSLC